VSERRNTQGFLFAHYVIERFHEEVFFGMIASPEVDADGNGIISLAVRHPGVGWCWLRPY
jgi:hypothetical protein